MVFARTLTEFNTGLPQSGLARDLYLNACEKEGEQRAYVLKKNKYGKAHLSQMEVALTAIAGLFIQKNLSPSMHCVTDDTHETWGVASEHMSTLAARKEGLSSQFWSILNGSGDPGPIRRFTAQRANDIPIYFLKDFGSEFFANLYNAQRVNHLSFDWDSLASILTSSYTLEEDDLHKGNIGFYIADKGGVPHVVFFKIDNDLMMADSLMSREMLRLWNFFNNESAFSITARDLKNFPKLRDSQNYYWPTTQRFFVNIGVSQHYGSAQERDAFKDLATEPAFIQAKWRAFYKHILLTDKHIYAVLSKHFDVEDPSQRAKLNLVLQAVVARQAKLRAVLFSMPEFRLFVRQLCVSDTEAILLDMPEDVDHDEVLEVIRSQQALCSTQNHFGFCEGDTPLHAAIRLGDYRYLESIDAFKSYLNTPNSLAHSPLDLAVKRAAILNGVEDDFRKDAASIAKHLLHHGAQALSVDVLSMKSSLEGRQASSSYVDRASVVETCSSLMILLRDIGEDSRLALKSRKDMALLCVKHYIHSHASAPNLESTLKALKVHLNGSALQKPDPVLDYIRQLRSQWWIVRYIRGLFGGTASQDKLNDDIDTALFALRPKSPGFWDFFRPAPDESPPAQTPVLR